MSEGATTSAPARACDSAALREQRQRRVVVHLPVADHAAVAVGGVLVQADVRDDEDLRDFLLQPPDGLLHGRPLVPGFAARLVLPLRNPEEDHRRHSQGSKLLRLRHGLVRRQAQDAGQRGDLLPQSLPVADEEPRDEAVGREARLAHERAQSRRPAKAPQAKGREAGHGGQSMSARPRSQEFREAPRPRRTAPLRSPRCARRRGTPGTAA